jgi:hypothetical protein
MDVAMASAAERNKIFGSVVAQLASRTDMMDLKII